MNRKVMKVLSIVLMVLMVVMTLSTSVFATNWDDMDINQFNNVKDNSTTSSTFTQVVGAIISLVQIVGMGVAIIMLIVMAIKYISAAPSEKAEIKKGVTIYIVGAIVLFAASGILQVIKSFATNNISASASTPASASGVVEVIDANQDTYLG